MRTDEQKISLLAGGIVGALTLALQSCVPPPPVHEPLPPHASGQSSAWAALPPSEIVRITTGSSMQPGTASSLSPTYADAYDYTDCDSFLSKGLSPAPGTGPTLFRYTLARDGTLRDASLFRSSGNEALDKAALECADNTHRQEAVVAGIPAQISWIGGVDWGNPRHGFFEPGPDGAPAATCKPYYSPRAIRFREQGDAIVGFRIGENGNPKDETVAQSSGSVSLDDAARRCVHAFRYFPAEENGYPVELDRTARIEFRILRF
jgi:TonB family protein